MTPSELRPVSGAFGLLLGLVLASPWAMPAMLPPGTEALFLLSAFMVRLNDRRWQRRPGAKAWISHIRMMRWRMMPWGALALVALMAQGIGQAGAVLAAAMLAELLLYPMVSTIVGRMGRGMAMAAMIALLAAMAWVDGSSLAGAAMRYTAHFALGIFTCVYWLRGPDGEPRALAQAVGAAFVFAIIAWCSPDSRGWSLSGAMAAAALTLAHMSTVRASIQAWRPRMTGNQKRRSGLAR
ncbi:hypothetical protein GGR44_003055 [Sphingobium fontiphilum]|uniref:Uncharacterized protein n=1 Tax=Sphingobium fontiphilum TaxID=944425 RepID=A0A7W6DME6_9SPHN|nr:hypothetical protein [Sphingobium fontiphilum]MBB3983367.1 hypothetical protein [Sphingobium fontiphilum]